MLSAQKKQSDTIRSFFSIDLKDNDKSQAFQVESYGRRFLILKEIFKRYKRFFNNYFGYEVKLEEVIESKIFKAYLVSDDFFGHKRSFPHYTGIGKGFENSSKFFFFALDYAPELALDLYSSMARHIHFQTEFSDVPFFKNFKDIITFEVEDRYFAIIGDKRILIGKNSTVPAVSHLNTYVNEARLL